MQVIIYFNEKPVYLCDAMDAHLEEILHHPEAVFVDELSTPAINTLLHEIKKENFHAGVIYHKDFKTLKKNFFKHFHVIEAAGGIVENKESELLFIFRRGKWDLPKGHMELKETQEACAAREIEEETGAKDLTLINKIGETYHTYNEFGKNILKISHWFYFKSNHPQHLKPQTEEDIVEIAWVKPADLDKTLDNTYQNIRQIIEKFTEKKTGKRKR